MTIPVNYAPRWLGGALVLLLVLAAGSRAQQAPPDVLLARIKARMAANLQNLPNYVCLETIERSRRLTPFAALVPTDRLNLEVVHVGERELYAWPGDEELGRLDLSTLVSGGLIANGTFALRARALFTRNDATFRYAGTEKPQGRELVRYDFNVAAETKRFLLALGESAGYVGEHGAFWADAESLDVVRIRSEADEIPSTIEIKSCSSLIEYGRSRIADSDFLLPTHAELRLAGFSGEESRNVTTFSACRKYSVESTVSFDFDEAPAKGKPPKPRAASVPLPAGLELRMELQTAIDRRKSAAGDRLEGRLTADVKQDGKLIVPAGAVVHGRLRRLERLPQFRDVLLAELEFRSVEFGDQVASFSAEMLSFQTLRGIDTVVRVTRTTDSGSGRISEIIRRDPVPGVGALFLDGPGSIPAGFRMVWRTTSPSTASGPRQ